MTKPLSVVCWKWDTGNLHPKKKLKFTADHVNRLRHMVERHLRLPHRFICVTDDARGLDDGTRVVNLWADYRELGGCFVRLKAFSEWAEELLGPRFLSIDLDTVIVDDITPLVDRPEDFVIHEGQATNTRYNGSMFLLTAGARLDVWRQFSKDEFIRRMNELQMVGSDQAWLSSTLKPDEATWGTLDGVYSWRNHLSRHLPKGENVTTASPIQLPPNARIIHFHGSSDPSQERIQRLCPWVLEHWR